MVERVEYLRAEIQFPTFSQWELLRCGEIEVDQRRASQSITSHIAPVECRGLRESSGIEPAVDRFLLRVGVHSRDDIRAPPGSRVGRRSRSGHGKWKSGL